MSQLACWLDWLDAHNGAVTAVATIFIAFFTIALAWVSQRQARLISSQIELSRKEFVASHPPKLIVRKFRLHSDHNAKTYRVHYGVVNVGGSTATITVWNESWLFNGDALKFPVDTFDYQPSRSLIGVNPLEVGMAWPGAMPISKGSEDAGCYENIRGRGSNLFVYGYIRHKDGNGHERETCFCRRYDHQGERFVIGDPDYEYAD